MTQKPFITIVAGPIHLIGEAKQVEAFYQTGKGSLPPWWEEWDQLLGDTWGMDILESPSDVTRLMHAAHADPSKPRVGFVSNSKLKLESGVTLGGENRDVPHVAKRLYAYWQTLPPAMQDKYAHFGSVGSIEGLLFRRDHYAQIYWSSDEQEKTVLETLAKKAKAEQSREGNVEANADDQPTVEANDTAAILKLNKPLRRYGGVACSRCGRLARTTKGDVLSAASLKTKGLATIRCAYCNEHLGQRSRERDNVQDRALPVFESPEWQSFSYDAEGNRLIPWGERPCSNPRMALGTFIRQRYTGKVNVFLHDEVHECKGARTSLAKAFGAMVAASHKTVGLTGTLYGGYASTLYYLLLRLGNTVIRDRWGWDNVTKFVDEVGVVDEIQKEITRDHAAGHYDGKSKTVTEKRERAGVTPELMTIVQNCAYTVLLKHMGFKLPGYIEDVVLLDMPATIQAKYEVFEQEGKAVIAAGGYDALSAYLQATLTWPYQPWRRKVIQSSIVDDSAVSDVMPAAMILPHHEFLAQRCADNIADGRRVIIFAEHTGKDDICEDIRAKVTTLAATNHQVDLKIAVLRSTTVKPGDRNAWFKARAEEGVNVVICNPRLVKTGLNLIQWPSIVVLEPIYSLYDLFQAKRRAFRPTQTKPCDVTFVGYRNSMSQRALSVVGRKAAAAAIMNGDDSAGGLLEFDPGMGLLQELAKQIRSSLRNDANDMATEEKLQALFAQSAQSLKADAEGATSTFLGVSQPINDVALEPTIEPVEKMPKRMLLNHGEVLQQALFDLVTQEVTITRGKAKGKVVATQQFAMAL